MIKTILRNSFDVAPLVQTVKVCDEFARVQDRVIYILVYIPVITLVGETTAVLSSRGSIVLSWTDQNRTDQL